MTSLSDCALVKSCANQRARMSAFVPTVLRSYSSCRIRLAFSSRLSNSHSPQKRFLSSSSTSSGDSTPPASSETMAPSPPTSYPYPHTQHPDGSVTDTAFPGTATQRLLNVLKNVYELQNSTASGSATPPPLSSDWERVTRPALLRAGGLSNDRSTSHAFNDDNHCDLCCMLGQVQHNQNADGAIAEISKRNFLGAHIEKASLKELGPGGSWSTCTNGCHRTPAVDVAHTQFSARIAFKLVWCPPKFERFVLLDDKGRELARGEPTGNLPGIGFRKGNFELVIGGAWERAAVEAGKD